MTAPEKISIKQLRKEAKESLLRKGMIVRCLSMYGSWSGFNGAEFYVLSDKAEPGWGHPMAVRHYFDVEPDAAQMLAKALDSEGKVLFYYTHLPANCVEVLNQNSWSQKDSKVFLQEVAWKEVWEENRQSYAKAYQTWMETYGQVSADEIEPWIKNSMKRCLQGMEHTWDKVLINPGPVFQPNMIESWVQDKE